MCFTLSTSVMDTSLQVVELMATGPRKHVERLRFTNHTKCMCQDINSFSHEP